MITESKWVKELKKIPYKNKAGMYDMVVWHDDTHHNIFDSEWVTILKVALDNKRIVDYTAETDGKFENITSIKLGEIADAPPKPTPSSEPHPAPPPTQRPSGQEVGLWWKEVGEMLRCGDIDTSKSHGKLVRAAYYAQMFSVLDIKFEKSEGKES